MNKNPQNNFVKLNFIKVRLWFSQLMHLPQKKQNKEIKTIRKKRILNTEQVDQLYDMLGKKK